MDIKNRVAIDNKVIHDKEATARRQRRRQEVIATTKDPSQRDRVGRKHALIEKYGEKRYDEIVRAHGPEVLNQ